MDLLFSDISFLCEATTAMLTLEQQNKPSVQQRTTDRSAIRAMPNELQQAPVCYMFTEYKPNFLILKSRILYYRNQ
jgi:hypothetical protein